MRVPPFSFIAVVRTIAQHFPGAFFATDMEGDNQTREQQHGGQLHRKNVRPKQRDTHLFGVNRRAVDTLIVNAENGVNDHHQQHRGKNGRTNPDPGFQPLTFLFDFAAAGLSIITTNTNSTIMAPA